jgi:rod shape-determining protein MreC
MSLRDNPLGELRVPLTWTAGIVFIVVMIVSVALLLSDRREAFDTDAYGRPRTLSDKVMAPVGEALSTPGRLTGEGVEGIRGYFFAVSENRRLRAELKTMQAWRDAAVQLRDVNDRYRAILGLKTDPPIPMATARVVTDSRGPFANSRLADAGSEKGIRVGNPVMSENGLVGRVIGVTNGVSRVLLLTDVASRTPVMIDRSNARAILTGDGGPNPKLEYLRGQNPVKNGDLVMTSGDGGLFPRGLPVGVAVKGLDGRWRVVLASDKAPVDFVRILLFDDFAQVTNKAALDRLEVPPPMPNGTEPSAAELLAQAKAPGPAPAPQTLKSAAAAPDKAAKPAPTAASPAKPASGEAAATKPSTPKSTPSAAAAKTTATKPAAKTPPSKAPAPKATPPKAAAPRPPAAKASDTPRPQEPPI